MTPSRNIAESVKLDLLRRYLVAHQWRRVERTDPARISPKMMSVGTDSAFLRGRTDAKANLDLYVLSEPGADDIELVVPRSINTPEYERRLEGAVTTLSQIEERDADQVIASINLVGFDIVQSRLPSELVLDETIYLESAKNYVNGMRNLLAATAMTEIKPFAFFARASQAALEFADRCRFGHTYRGSFGFTIESPLNPVKQETLFGLDPTPPFERRVLERLGTGIQQLCDAADKEDLEPLRNAFRLGFGANACERFALLIRNTAYSGLWFKFLFSPEWQAPENLGFSKEFFVGPKHVEVARAAADLLRGDSREIPTDVYGMVTRLQNEADPSDLSPRTGEGEIVVLYATEDFGDIHLRITLSPQDYLTAVDAHRLGRPIRVAGIMYRQGRYWYLRHPSDVIISFQRELGFDR